jgi:hypothetical protein
MFTLFHVFVLVGGVFGFAFGLSIGAKLFGIVGGIVGALAGGCLGVIVGRIPESLLLRSLARHLKAKSTVELRAQLHGSKCLTPNVVLLELQSRGEDIRQELPVVLDLLVSEDTGRRGQGWAALSSAFPELVERIRDYRIGDSVDECRRKTEILRNVAYTGRREDCPPGSRTT